MSFLSRLHSNHCNLPPSIGADMSLHQWTCAITHFPGLVPNQPIFPIVATLQFSWRPSWRFITWKINCNILIHWNAQVVNSLELSRGGGEAGKHMHLCKPFSHSMSCFHTFQILHGLQTCTPSSCHACQDAAAKCMNKRKALWQMSPKQKGNKSAGPTGRSWMSRTVLCSRNW